jgi:predicted acetyltransferase
MFKITAMPKHQINAQLELIPATLDQRPILANLLELYAHDFSEFYDVDLGPDGKFGYVPLPLYWTDPARHPFLVEFDSHLAGFVLVKRGSEFTGNEIVWDVVEFFITRRYRRRGIGTHIAHEVWTRFPGPWQVRVLQSNVSAHEFWASAISTFIGHSIHPTQVEKDDERWNLFSFESRHRP